MFTSRIKIVGLTIASTLISATALAGNAQADTFSINGKALNTNGAFSRIDGQPRVTIWDVVPNDPDQDYQRLSGNRGGVLLKNRKTGNCINAYRKFNGAEFNTWPCNPNDPDQNWQINSLGGNVVQLKLAGTNFCIDTPTRTNGGKVYLWGCDANNGNQRFSTNSSDGVIIAEQAAMMRSQATNRTLDAGGSNYSIYMHPRPDNNPYQRWRFDRVGTSSEYMIISVATGRALDGGGASGAQANLHPGPNANNPFQHGDQRGNGSSFG